MSTPRTLLLCRQPPWAANLISANPFVRKIWPRVIASHQIKGDYKADQVFYDWAVPEAPDASRKFLRELLESQNVSHVVASQKGLWYSDILEELCREMSINLVWSEPFFDGKCIFDKSGLPYSPQTDLWLCHRFADNHGLDWGEPDFPKQTREQQKESETHGSLVGLPKNGIAVFGQVPHDMALKYFTGLPYLQWLDRLFLGNPDEKFFFKHHPRMQTPGIERYQNVRVIDFGIKSIFRTFERFAAFSSTTILEGMIARQRKFITGGYHFGLGFDYNCGDPAGRLKHLEDLQWTPLVDAGFKQRLGFITNAYTLPLTDARVAKRILLPTDQFLLEQHYRKNL